MCLSVMARCLRRVCWWRLVGFVIGFGLGWYEGEDWASLLVAGSIGMTLVGTVVPGLWYLRTTVPTRVIDRKSTRLNSSHVKISYAVFCLKKKKNIHGHTCLV